MDLSKFTKKAKFRAIAQIVDGIDWDELYFAGGTHLIFEDGNLEDHIIESCKEYSIEKQSLNGYILCCILETLNLEERKEYFNSDRESLMKFGKES